jgi:hypothetical protein
MLMGGSWPLGAASESSESLWALVGILRIPLGPMSARPPYAQKRGIRARKNVPRYGEGERMSCCGGYNSYHLAYPHEYSWASWVLMGTQGY